MNNRQMKYVLALAEYKRFATVAEKLFVSHTSVSKQIHALEEELGVMLFYRTRQGVELTPEGTIFVEALKEGKAVVDGALENIIKSNEFNDRLFVGFVEYFDSKKELITAVKDFRNRYKDTELLVSSYSYTGIRDTITERRADVFLCPEECVNTSIFNIQFLWQTQQALLVPADHELVKIGHIDGYDFSRDRFLIIGISPPDRRSLIDKLKHEFGAKEGQITVFENMENFAANMETLHGLSVIPMLDMYIHDPDFCFMPVSTRVWKPCRIVAAWRKDNTKPALIKFISVLREYFQKRVIID